MSLVLHHPLDGARWGSEYPLVGNAELEYLGQRKPCAGPLDLPGTRFMGGYAHQLTNNNDLSIATTGELTVMVHARPSTLTFPVTEGSGYVHLLSKGMTGSHEWCLRMYSDPNQENRGNRVSCYAFNPSGSKGAGSHFQHQLQPNVWFHVAAVYDAPKDRISIYKDGVLQDWDTFSRYNIIPQAGAAPLQVATRGGSANFIGALADLRIYNTALTQEDINLAMQGLA